MLRVVPFDDPFDKDAESTLLSILVDDAPSKETETIPAKDEKKAVYHATVHDIPPDERPRERLQHYGAETLTTSDLLAIILRTGTQQDNVMELAGKMLVKYKGLAGLMNAHFHEIANEHGLGPAKVCQLKAALELGKRLSIELPDKGQSICGADDAANIARVRMMHLDREEMHILVLDTKNHLVEYVTLYKGTINTSVLRTAEIFRTAVVRNCPHLIVCHNHPSGDPTPSPEDMAVTRQLVEAARILDLELLDHIVIGNPRYVSLKQIMQW